MKILLIEPAKAPATLGGEDFFIYEPLALEYIAAGVVQDHDVRILDLRLEHNLPTTIALRRTCDAIHIKHRWRDVIVAWTKWGGLSTRDS